MNKTNIILLSVCTVLLAGGFIYKASASEKTNTSVQKAGINADNREKAPVNTGAVSQPRNTQGYNIGDTVPDIVMYSPDSAKQYKLSDLKGYMVLIDFWASWCGPCRRENPVVVKAYETYKNKKFNDGFKGFKVFSVSLDQNNDSWKAAIVKDSLVWDEHVSDLKYWSNAAAVKYGVNSIPTNYLINGDRVVVGKALRGEQLIQNLETLPGKLKKKKEKKKKD